LAVDTEYSIQSLPTARTPELVAGSGSERQSLVVM
jgi:hypothetical protein